MNALSVPLISNKLHVVVALSRHGKWEREGARGYRREPGGIRRLICGGVVQRLERLPVTQEAAGSVLLAIGTR
jgi:hypothetical protein